MKFLLSLLTSLTIAEPATGIFLLTPYFGSIKTKEVNSEDKDETMFRASIIFENEVRQSYFDAKSGKTYYSRRADGKQEEQNNKLFIAEMDTTSDKAYQRTLHTRVYKENDYSIDMNRRTLIYADATRVSYFDRKENKLWKLDIQQKNTFSKNGEKNVQDSLSGMRDPQKPADIARVYAKENMIFEETQEQIKDAVFFEEDNSFIYSTLTNDGTYRIKKIKEGENLPTLIYEKTSLYAGLHPILAKGEDSLDHKDIFYHFAGEVFVIRNKNGGYEKTPELISKIGNGDTNIDARQGYKLIVEKDGLWVGLADKIIQDTNDDENQRYPEGNIKSYFIKRSNNKLSQILPSESDVQIEQVLWVENTKYIILKNGMWIKNPNTDSSLSKELLFIPEKDELGKPRKYSGIFDFGVMFQGQQKKGKNHQWVQNIYSDKFQESIRFSDLGNGLDYGISSKNEIYVWDDKNPFQIKIRRKSYINQVEIFDDKGNEHKESVVTTDQYWIVTIDLDKNIRHLKTSFFEPNASSSYQSYYGWLNFVNANTQKIDISLPEYSISNLINWNNKTNDSEILAALRDVTKLGSQLTEKDLLIEKKVADFGVPGEIKISASQTSRLIMNSQQASLYLYVDLAKFDFSSIDFADKKNEADVKAEVLRLINAYIKENSTNTQNEKEITEADFSWTYKEPSPKEKGEFEVSANASTSEILINTQKVIIPSTDAIDLSKLEYELHEDGLENGITDEQILSLIQDTINKNTPKITISIDDIDILRKNASVGQNGSILVSAKKSSALLKNSKEFITKILKFDLGLLNFNKNSNDATEKDVLEQLNNVSGLGNKIGEKDISFNIDKATIEKEGKISISPSEPSKLLMGTKEIIIPKIYDLAEENLFDEMQFFNETTSKEVYDYLKFIKGWKYLEEEELEVEVSKKSTFVQKGLINIKSKSNAVRIQNYKNEIITNFDRHDLDKDVFKDIQRELGNFEKVPTEDEIQERIIKLNPELANLVWDDISIDDILVIDGKVTLKAKKESLNYKNFAVFTFTNKNKTLIPEITEDITFLGKFKTIPNITEVQKKLEILKYEPMDFEITHDQANKTYKAEAKKESTLSGSIEFKYELSQNLSEVIKETSIDLPKEEHTSVDKILEVLKLKNPDLILEAVEVIFNDNKVIVKDKEDDLSYVGEVEITINIKKNKISNEILINEGKNLNLGKFKKASEIQIVKNKVEELNLIFDDFEIYHDEINKVYKLTAKANSEYEGFFELNYELSQNLSEVIKETSIDLPKEEHTSVDKILEVLKLKNPDLILEAVEVIFNDNKVIVKDKEDDLSYVGEVELVLKDTNKSDWSNHKNRTKIIWLWILVALNSIVWILVAVITLNIKKRNRKLDE
ncbi:hypothetical protein [Mesoplasma tabanidae]|uniref:Uncharacterized protein n=1 Tax=Mesoplasma tabanidae TaxID=219745 RepID=A0A2K8P4N4_9MOLU|nr:hypothetical protein [Mesoplasma tabanidae]ATZ21711.1 hypothetical protein MTABA_v1c05150 [Mesoplasma tabanidae]